MDCNNYSYINTSGTLTAIAEAKTESGSVIYLSLEHGYFGDWFYSVSDIFGEIEAKEFDFTPSDETGESQAKAYEKAARRYNDCVSDADAIPLF